MKKYALYFFAGLVAILINWSMALFHAGWRSITPWVGYLLQIVSARHMGNYWLWLKGSKVDDLAAEIASIGEPENQKG